MTPVIREGLALPIVPDSDVRAIAVYFSDMNHAHGGALGTSNLSARPTQKLNAAHTTS
jgi:hypothetical protein